MRQRHHTTPHTKGPICESDTSHALLHFWNVPNRNILHFGDFKNCRFASYKYQEFGSNPVQTRFSNIWVFPNPERNHRSGSGQWPNLNPEPGFGSGRFNYAKTGKDKGLYVHPFSHCEYDNGYLVFDRMSEEKDVWRLASDFFR
ncbi:hypothetical protein EDB86DRAFT_2827561 [Lactarius hatsudake]|nr:hypothetical protein EDB86DRAFT_2827561 [Lactarius hatsudake]